MTEPNNPAQPTLAEILNLHLRVAAERDLNPFRRGYQNQLISLLAPLFPEMDRLGSLSLNWSENGWLQADNLYQIAELSEKFGPGLCFIQSPGGQALLPALDPDRTDELWDSLPRVGARRLTPQTMAGPSRCPLWGPCLGQRVNYADLLAELAQELAKELDDSFRVELAGCPRDCRMAMERSDVGLILDEGGRSLQVWLGGRHRFGRDPISPEYFRVFELAEAWPMLDLVFRIHDHWFTHRLPEDETLPELAKRLGPDFLNQSSPEPLVEPWLNHPTELLGDNYYNDEEVIRENVEDNKGKESDEPPLEIIDNGQA
ncbi:MAG: hypothetical protein LBR11_13145 [Deltaproteobacteria bacterium]|nr:hypothetical protein [Deltaproteobacteria bacterium]